MSPEPEIDLAFPIPMDDVGVVGNSIIWEEWIPGEIIMSTMQLSSHIILFIYCTDIKVGLLHIIISTILVVKYSFTILYDFHLTSKLKFLTLALKYLQDLVPPNSPHMGEVFLNKNLASCSFLLIHSQCCVANGLLH